MRYRRWNVAFLCWVLAVLLFVAAMNYFVDPYGYFSYQSGDYARIYSASTSYFSRELKAEHVLHFAEDYDAFLLGGSKAGAFRAEKLQEMDGYRYYNMFQIHGNFYEYELMVKFLMAHADPKKIMITLSGGEVNSLLQDQESLSTKLPAVVTGGSKALEILDFLFKDVGESFAKFKARGFSTASYEGPTGGERDLSSYYPRTKDDAAWEQFTKKSVLGSFQNEIKRLFTRDKRSKYYQENLDALQRIKDLCDAHGTKLLVVVVPSFFSKYQSYDSTYYRDYLEDIARITDFWDFSGYNEITLNPYNFYDGTHFYYETADLIIDTIDGADSYPGFGQYVTRETAAEYVAGRQAQYEALRQEYQDTGTIRLQGMEDESCLVRRKAGEA